MLIKPRKALNKAFLKIRPDRIGIELFKAKLILLLDSSKANESEEFHKNLISDFLKNTYYSPTYFINTKGRNDLVIHTNSETKSNVGVIIEAKSPTNKAEMISEKNLNNKALQELVLYFLRERITHKNLEVKHLVATNLNEWFLFDAQIFDKLFAHNKAFVKQFQDFEEGKLSGATTDFFYREIAKPYIASVIDKIEYTYFDLATYDTILRNADKDDDAKLIVLYKLLSPEHLLKLSFANDSNSLDKNFYNELLHLIGLTETKEGGKKLIQRPKVGERNSGSLLENTINQLDSLDKISRLTNPKQYGATHEERLFTVGLELCITWVNRILFLKLLEAQLISYHKGDRSYAFLHKEALHDYDNLNALFFMVLAKKPEDRNDRVKTLFAQVPYLNSSLFEPTDLEHETLFIAGLEDTIPLPFISATVIKDGSGKKQKGSLNALEYFFEFLDAYDFASEGSEAIQEDNKTLINASVLGLIFEKINGYKDGSFYTPSFITMYMCKETIRRAVVQKFKSVVGTTKAGENFSKVETFTDLYNSITDLAGANAVINSLKICDPAVGSGHFLVSALNEIIAIKHDLGILLDRKGKRLKEYQIDIVNDELIITDDDGVPFTYNPNSAESQRVQETLFHEKQTIIENCLFGVDINPNSVKICRLRLWIELLKNAYYKFPSAGGVAEGRGGFSSGHEHRHLETLPNIDINIKCGNSLIARFGLDADLKKALKQSKWNIESYKLAVDTYRNAESKEQKKDMERLIADIKGNFRSEIATNDPKKLTLEKKKGELFNYTQQVGLFERSKKEQTAWNKTVNTLSAEVQKLETDIEEIKNNKIYENAFEWRFEFPEVLNDDGDFVGFDVVIGNPPYVGIEDINWNYRRFYETIYKTASGRFDLYSLFIEKAMQIKKPNGAFTYIIPGKFLNNRQFVEARKLLCVNHGVTVVKIDDKVFEDAQVDSVIVENYPEFNAKYKALKLTTINLDVLSDISIEDIANNSDYIFRLEVNNSSEFLINKIQENTLKIKDIAEVKDGIVAGAIKDLLFAEKEIDADSKKIYFGKNISRYHLNNTKIWVNYKPEVMMAYEVERKNGKRAGLWMRDIKIFEREKIIYRKVGKELIATFAERGVFYEQTVHSCHITNKEYATKFILGLFNSSLFKYYYHNVNSQGGDIFPQIRISSVENLPIKITSLENQQPFIEKVNQILTQKQANPSADTSILEREIDEMVYALYGLNEDEIAVVEGS